MTYKVYYAISACVFSLLPVLPGKAGEGSARLIYGLIFVYEETNRIRTETDMNEKGKYGSAPGKGSGYGRKEYGEKKAYGDKGTRGNGGRYGDKKGASSGFSDRRAKTYGTGSFRRNAEGKSFAGKPRDDAEKLRRVKAAGGAPACGPEAQDAENGAVPGRNAVRELLKSGRDVEKIFVSSGDREGSITVLVAEAIARGIPVIETDKKKLDALCGYEQHQGIVAIASEIEYSTLEDVVRIAEERNEKPLVVICDGVSDPHNLGAVIRCAEGAGAHGVVIPKRRAAGITPAVAKAAAGATEHMACVKCSNINDTVRKLKEMGFWIFAAEADGESYTDADFSVPCALVLGSEENGVGDLVKKNSDYVVSIPMRGKVNSLNVSTAAAVLLYEVLRQRGIK